MKIKHTLFLLLVLIGLSPSYAGLQSDSLLQLKDLQFRNSKDQEAYARYCATRTKDDLLPLLLMHYDASKETDKDVLKDINASVEEIRTTFLPIKNHKKQIKAITGYVFQKYLKQYKLTNGFSEIFSTSGYYNCVSSTALYAILFSKLGIEYSIRDTPSHVFLIAYPSTDKILIEATVGAEENEKFSDRFQSGYLKELKEQGIITKSEYESTTSEELFKKYSYEKESITLEQLIGLQMRNYALYLEDDSIKTALIWIKRSYVIYPCLLTEYNLRHEVSIVAENMTYKELSDVSNMILYIKVMNKRRLTVPKTNVIGEFEIITNQELLEDQNYSLYNQSYQLYRAAFPDTAISNHVDFIYNFSMAKKAIEKKWLDTLRNRPYLDNAYKLDPNNIQMLVLIMSHLSLEAFDMAEKGKDDARAVLDMLDGFVVRYPTLKNNETFAKALAEVMLIVINGAFREKDEATGMEAMDNFTRFMKEHPSIRCPEGRVEDAFASIARYYHKKGNDRTAAKWLRAGLVYYPENEELLRLLSLCDE